MNLEDRAYCNSSIKTSTLHNIGHVEEAEVYIKVLWTNIVWNRHMECFVRMAEHLDMTALLPKRLDGFSTLQKEVHSDGLEDLLH